MCGCYFFYFKGYICCVFRPGFFLNKCYSTVTCKVTLLNLFNSKMFALLSRVSFWPLSSVYISVINIQTLQITFLITAEKKYFDQLSGAASTWKLVEIHSIHCTFLRKNMLRVNYVDSLTLLLICNFINHWNITQHKHMNNNSMK